jgi:hypothetical protein
MSKRRSSILAKKTSFHFPTFLNNTLASEGTARIRERTAAGYENYNNNYKTALNHHNLCAEKRIINMKSHIVLWKMTHAKLIKTFNA